MISTKPNSQWRTCRLFHRKNVKGADENNNRIEWIDALKGFGIFCVTLGHLNMWSPIEKWIYSFHMFLFFFLSGFLFSARKPAKEILKARIQRLLIPFIAWNVVSSLAGLFLLNNSFSEFVEELFVLNGNLTCNPTIWFLLVLFLAEITVVLLRLYKHKWLAASTIILCLVLWIVVGHTWCLWKLNLLPMAICFFLSGFVLKPIVSKLCKWYILLPLGIGSVAFSLLNSRIVYTYGLFGNYLYCILAAFCGVLLFVGLFSGVKFFSRLPVLQTWGRNSLMIMATQYFAFYAISLLSTKVLHTDLIKYNSSAVSLLLALFVTALINAMVTLYKKYTDPIKPLRFVGEIFGAQY